ncbi:hypothetical protein PHMEG_00022422 [Phytophthora megakarya]|uniref:Uncharacterized protein n=1 Tax=Phytophthora megakarya TaxID=4795 RepID=A0A225VKF1_9STRA|nr:hypothetical protein PHMEG_00022422 [Phytophthora megakarya]
MATCESGRATDNDESLKTLVVRIRHMAKHERFINEYIQAKELDVTYVPSIENIADVFTKALGPAEFERQRSRLNVEDVPSAWAVVVTTPQGDFDKDIEMHEAIAPKTTSTLSATRNSREYEEDGGFDLYKARLESYLRQQDCCTVVIGTEGPDPLDEDQQRNFEERNLFARDALIYGLLSKDAKNVCKITRVSEMWTTFEREKTQRGFANSIRVRAMLFGSK